MSAYEFEVVRSDRPGVLEDQQVLLRRPFVETESSFGESAEKFVPGKELEIAINTAIAVGQPLLITGEPGVGKTQAAYYAAYKLGIEPVIHFQVKSDSTARDLLYYYDAVEYFREAHLNQDIQKKIDKANFVYKRELWKAMHQAEKLNVPRALLIDEIDKAPRDFPNDLLHELDKMEFKVTETDLKVKAEKALRPIVFITSNSERRLPEPFLRRCVYHNIRFDENILKQAVESRMETYRPLSSDFLNKAIQRFLALRSRGLRKIPATGEMLVWLRVLALAAGTDPDSFDIGDSLSKTPYLGVLLKDRQDIEELSS